MKNWTILAINNKDFIDQYVVENLINNLSKKKKLKLQA